MVDFGHPMRRADSLEKTLMLGKIEGRREENDRGWDGWTASLTHGLEFEQIPGDSEGQGNLVGCSSWSGKESDTTERLNGNKYINRILRPFILLDARGAPWGTTRECCCHLPKRRHAPPQARPRWGAGRCQGPFSQSHHIPSPGQLFSDTSKSLSPRERNPSLFLRMTLPVRGADSAGEKGPQHSDQRVRTQDSVTVMSPWGRLGKSPLPAAVGRQVPGDQGTGVSWVDSCLRLTDPWRQTEPCGSRLCPHLGTHGPDSHPTHRRAAEGSSHLFCDTMTPQKR